MIDFEVARYIIVSEIFQNNHFVTAAADIDDSIKQLTFCRQIIILYGAVDGSRHRGMPRKSLRANIK